MKTYHNLLSPIQVGTLTLKNRIALAPMSFTRQAPDGGYSPENIAFVEEVAKGGTGLIVLGESVTGNNTGKTHVDMTMIGDPKMDRSLFLLAEAVHRYGGAISVEVNHGGVFSPPQFNHGQMPMGPSKYPNNMGFGRGDGSIVVPMDEKMMNEVADSFAETVAKLKEFQFDMAQIHFGHGWLIHQFLSPLFNRREDEYGGTIENRMRFPLMILKRIRERVGKSFPLDVRISGVEPLPGGLSHEDVLEVCKAIEEYVNMISVSCGGVFHEQAAERMSPSIFLPRGVNVYLAESVRSQVKIPIATVGALSEPDDLEQILQKGRADIVYLGRQLIADPLLPKKAMEGRCAEIFHCIRCSACQNSICREPQRLMRCSVNPTAGLSKEKEVWELPTRTHKKILIAGGGPAGMQAALIASKRGHQVILCEKENRLGGMLEFADHISFKQDIRIYRDRQAALVLSNRNIEVRLGTRVTKELIREIHPDVVLVAIGAKAAIPQIPGIKKENVITGVEVAGNEQKIGKKVGIIGGGLVGAESAIHLAYLGHEVTLVEMTSKIAKDCSLAHNRGITFELEKYVTVYTETECIEITDTGIMCKDSKKEFTIEVDTVINATGMCALTKEAYELDGEAPELYLIGDCKKVGKILNATRDGYFAAVAL